MRTLLALPLCLGFVVAILAQEPLPNTSPLTLEGDIAAQLVEGVDRFLLRKLDESGAVRKAAWKVGQELSPADEEALRDSHRKQFAKIIGAVDPRVPFNSPQLLATVKQSALIAESPIYSVYTVRWPTVRDLFAEGLLVVPKHEDLKTADLICIPDADQTPEQILGLAPGVDESAQFARFAAETGCRVLIPTLLSRKYEARNGRAKMTDREFIYRSAFELGRHIIGYEVQEVLAGVDWLAKDGGQIGVLGYGEGGMLALYATMLDDRIRAAWISGYLDRGEDLWKKPIDRNVFGLLKAFADRDLAEGLRSRNQTLFIEGAEYPAVKLPSEGGAPAEITRPAKQVFMTAAENWVTEDIAGSPYIGVMNYHEGGVNGELAAMSMVRILKGFADRKFETLKLRVKHEPATIKATVDAAARQKRLFHAMDVHNQWLLSESSYVRAEFMKGLDTSSPEKFAATVEPYRENFKREVIGWFDDERLPLNPRSRKIIDKEKYTGYEVVLDVWKDVIAYGILLVPKDIKDGEARPTVVCQHGLEGRPQDIVQGDHPAYHDFAAKLAERGFVTFSPQNLYIGKDKFRTLQRKANPLGRTLFSIIIPQHQQIVAWLKTLPQVDGERIGFYGLSYGGKSAMRIPPLVPEYKLSICSADFNEWVWKNASSRAPYSYVWTNEYEIFEWDLGSTFNYAEMAALIAPRPFMVERGHFDGVAPDEAVGHEFAKVFRLYNTGLKLGDKCEIEWFVGPHTINGQGTYRFLHKHLQHPEPK